MMKSYLFKPEQFFLDKREETIKTLRFAPGSMEAQAIRAMTDAFFSGGLQRAVDLISLYAEGKVTKEDLLQAIEEQK